VPLIVLEPSCAAVFRDELLQLFPEDPRARRLSALTHTLAELLESSPFKPPRLAERAVVHGHCHHKAVMGMEADRALLSRIGLDFEILDSGCCGMAGAFGFDKDHYEVSIACGERVLLPAVRAAAPGTLVIADGFSCREQIVQTTGRRALHLAEVARLTLPLRLPVA
jgi:Fe-S oxidoreductase